MIIKDIIKFLASDPNEIQTEKMNRSQQLFLAVKTLFFIYIIKLSFTAIQVSLIKYGILREIKGTDGGSTLLSESGPALFLLEFVLIGPILEEFGFRAILQRSKLLTAAGVSSMILLVFVLLFNIPIYSLTSSSVLAIGLAIAIFAVLINTPSILLKITEFTNNHTRGILWINATAFACWHFYNFDFAKAGVFEVVWYLTPHFIVALILSWISIKASFLTACAVHVCNNLLPAVFFLYANQA